MDIVATHPETLTAPSNVRVRRRPAGTPSSTRAPCSARPVATGHFRRNTAFVDEDDLRRIDVPGFLPPELALRFDALAVLLGSME
jgi:hypothetical protein